MLIHGDQAPKGAGRKLFKQNGIGRAVAFKYFKGF